MLTSAVTLASARHELGDGPVGITRELSKLSSVGDGCGSLLWVGGGARDAGLGGDREGGGGVSSSKEETETSLLMLLDSMGLDLVAPPKGASGLAEILAELSAAKAAKAA